MGAGGRDSAAGCVATGVAVAAGDVVLGSGGAEEAGGGALAVDATEPIDTADGLGGGMVSARGDSSAGGASFGGGAVAGGANCCVGGLFVFYRKKKQK